MKNILRIGLCFGLFNYSCTKENKSSIVIEGNGFDKQIKKVYLTEARKWDVYLDSADCINGKFKFEYKPTTSFEPFLATVSYMDKNRKKQNFFVRNKILIKKDGKNHAHSGFILNYGTTKFEYYGFLYGGDLVNVKGGAEQDLFQNFDHQNFGYISKVRSNIREKQLTSVVALIKDNSFSFYLLSKINENRQQYSKVELEKILKYFDKDVRNSKSADILQEYIDNMPIPNGKVMNLSLFSDGGILKKGINKTAKLNMLIFWASWCGPCRLEIPNLKKINKQVNSKDFFMASISIDKNVSFWKRALREENLSWDQFIVNEKDINKVQAMYGFTAIPLVVFTNSQGKELKRFSGYEPNQIIEYLKVVKTNL